MVSRICFALVIWLISVSSAAEGQALVNKWQFVKVIPDSSEEADLTLISNMFEGMTFYFKNDGSYKRELLSEKEEGTYFFDQKNEKIVLTSYSGKVHELAIIKMDEEGLVMLVNDAQILLKQIAPSKADEEVSIGVQVTLEQIARQWTQYHPDNPDKDKKYNDLKRSLAEGNFIELKPNGKYKARIASNMKTGSWRLNNDQTAVIVMIGRSQMLWRVEQISDEELVLFSPGSDRRRYYKLSE